MAVMNDRAYYAARAAKAFQLAETASDPELEAIHRRAAASYLELEQLTPPGRRTLRIVEDKVSHTVFGAAAIFEDGGLLTRFQGSTASVGAP